MSAAATSPVNKKAPLPKLLAYCKGFDEQVRWVEDALQRGRTLSDPGIWLGGADPDAVIRHLRKKGLAIKTVRVSVTDAADEVHTSIAWRLFKDDEPRPAPRKRAGTATAAQPSA